MQTQTAPVSTHIATLDGESVECSAANYTSVIDGLLARHPGKGVPLVVRKDAIEASTAPLSRVEFAKPTAPAPVADVDGVSVAGKFRAMTDEATAREAGFAPRPPLYSIGTRVNEIGVANARASQVDHNAKPLAREASLQLARVVAQEERRDVVPLRHADIQMRADGQLVYHGAAGENVLPLEHHAFSGLMTRAIPAKGAASYLGDCPPVIRAANWNRWRAEQMDEPATHVLRTRLGADGTRRAFAAVSERYAAYDADKVGAALALAFPEDARGTLDYDGSRYRVEGLWHSDVAPEEYVAGEIFKAGVIVRGADDGSGAIRVQSVIWRNLCLNLIILNKAVGEDIRIRHTGNVRDMASAFQAAFLSALSSVQGFRHAWSGAMKERDTLLVERSNGTTSDDLLALPNEAVLPGLFNGILQRQLVAVPGRKQDIVPKLLDMHRQDEAAAAYGISRASIVNAFTRYAHQVEQDPFRADEIREGAGNLLAPVGRASIPEPIPYVAFPML